MSTSPLSNASFNVTVSSGGMVANAVANSSIGRFAVVNLNDNDITTLSITYVPSEISSRLDIGNITITVLNTSIIPTSSSATPTPTNSDNNAAAEKKKKLISTAVGLTLGLGLGLTAVTCAIYLLWRRRRRRKRDASGERDPLDDVDEALAGAVPSSQPLSPLSRSSGRRTTKDNMDTRWYNF
ncbi:hypothetical protein PM082_010528 [Marasmius tenuissimus]|nr:hypothetical protein PM082_010528 [Marasmius tenuissimus]